ncbi:hypothetical protein DXG03_006611 [Asterophora parasitica]|uniref:Uncharacterized protein n=1 Tax=Asterophora parasitica TaxID=117018 RepID=A0A9P7K8B8_9AGAR|nr:hypothetical protein DXG03_006611 [Asterophora parasitica]
MGSGTKAIFSWLKSAGHHPVTLDLKLSPATPSSALHELFLLHGSHTRGLSLTAPFSALQGLATMFQTAPSRHRPLFPNVEVLHFSMPCKDMNRPSTRRFTAMRNIDLRGCAKLRTLQFDSIDNSFGFITDHLISGTPYSQLTHLYITERSLHPLVARKILMGCCSLTRCYMQIGQWPQDDDVPVSDDFITLGHLDALVVRFASDNHGLISPFFETLTLPSLRRLTIEAPNALDADLVLVLKEMQDRSKAPIERLALMNIFIIRDQLLDLLSSLPTLQYLHVQAPPGETCCGYIDVLIAISLPDTARLVPLLEEICIVDNLFPRYSDESGRLARDLVGKPLDISNPLKDYQVLEAIEKRCSYYRPAATQGLRDPGVGRKALQVVTVKWRNVPEEWRDAERPALARQEEIEDQFEVAFYLPLCA